MINVFLVFLMSLFGPHHGGATTHNDCGQVTTLDDTGGETGHIPPKPPTPPTQP